MKFSLKRRVSLLAIAATLAVVTAPASAQKCSMNSRTAENGSKRALNLRACGVIMRGLLITG